MSIKPGATTRPLASISRLGGVGGNPADRHDPVAANGHIAAKPRIAGAIDDVAVANDEVVRRFIGSLDRSNRAEDGDGEE